MAYQYAATTDVPANKSREDIERTITRYGGDDIAIGTSRAQGVAAVEFTMPDEEGAKRVRFTVQLPGEGEFTRTPKGRLATESSKRNAYEQAVRTKWRALLLVIKANLEAVESGIVSFDVAFMPYIVLPDGRTVAQSAMPSIREALRSGVQPAGFLAIESGD